VLQIFLLSLFVVEVFDRCFQWFLAMPIVALYLVRSVGGKGLVLGGVVGTFVLALILCLAVCCTQCKC